MNGFRLADQTINWQGIDSTTPAGCSLAVGTDQLGNLRIWLFEGEEPRDERLLGSVLTPQDPTRPLNAYGPRGGWMASGFGQGEVLAKLAARTRTEA